MQISLVKPLRAFVVKIFPHHSYSLNIYKRHSALARSQLKKCLHDFNCHFPDASRILTPRIKANNIHLVAISEECRVRINIQFLALLQAKSSLSNYSHL